MANKEIENLDKFYSPEVAKWKRADFIKHFKERFPNAEEIYDAIVPKRKRTAQEEE